jgi:hypothetical protein
MDFKNLKKKIRELTLPNVCDFQKENHTLGYEFNLKTIEIYSLASGFLFFVISISACS